LKRAVKILDAAAEEVAQAAAWYEHQREGLGFEFQEAIDAALDTCAWPCRHVRRKTPHTQTVSVL
jgi:hypothetical protein